MATFTRSVTLAAVSSVLALALGGCGGGGTSSSAAGAFFLSTPNTVAVVSGNGQGGTVGSALTYPLVVRVTNYDGAGLPNVTVTFAVTSGEGTLASPTATTDSNGYAQTTFTLSRIAGANVVTATVAGATVTPSVTFTEAGTPGAPAFLTVPAGTSANLSGVPGGTVTLSAVVTDADGNPIPRTTVSFAITSGGGSLSSATATASDTGQAQVILTLPPAAGVTTVTATVAGFSEALTFTVTS